MTNPSNILIARLSSIGDIILTTAVVRSVRKAFPEARITFLVKKEFSALLINNPNIDRVITFDKSGGTEALNQLKDQLKNENYDWFIDLHNNLRTNYLKRSIRFPQVSTYSKQSFRRWLLVKIGRNMFSEAKPVYLRYFDAVQNYNISYDGKGTDVLVSDDEKLKVEQILSSDGIDVSKPLFVLCPGASFSNKQWIPSRFGELADLLIEQRGGQLIFLGGPNDKHLCDDIINGMKQKALNYAGQLSLLGSAALLSYAKVVITNDSGMMHLAQSQKTAVVAIFGPTTRQLGFFPLETRSRVIEKEVDCRPCTTKGLNYCPKKHFNCMQNISTMDVMKASLELL
ncbi:MAG: lipopolysaccharide heptosyltransferase II [Bacteroidetes bacterium]|nr:lipopolysaccharide heptosyltransferase II [Bacteroidota bacterium]